MKYCFSKNVRIKKDGIEDEVSCDMFVYDDFNDAEIAYHNELAYGLSLNNLVLAHYQVTNERGNVVFGLQRTVDRTENTVGEEQGNKKT